MELHSRGGGGPVREDQSPKKKKIQKKIPKEEIVSRSLVPPQRATLELCTKLGSTRLLTHGEALRWWFLWLSCCVDRSLFQGAYSHTEKEMRGQRMRHKIADREWRAFEVCLATFRTLFQGAYSFTEKECVVKECVMK